MPLYMEDQAEFDLAYGQIKELHKLCCGDNLTLAALQQRINTLDERDIENISLLLYHGLDPGEVNAYDDTPFLHYACSNKSVTLEIIQYLLEEWATGLTDVHPLCPDITAIHFLCCNEDCPDDVIRFLFKEHPEVFERMCLVVACTKLMMKLTPQDCLITICQEIRMSILIPLRC